MGAQVPTIGALVVPRRIRAARELRGYTQREVVRRLKDRITTGALSQLESGKVRPSAATLNALADTLEVPVSFFTSQWPSTGSPEEDPLTYFRDLRSTSAAERRRATATSLLLADLLEAIELYVRLPEPSIPTFSLPQAATNDDVEAAAIAVRSAWSLGTDPVPHVVRELERHGIPVARLSLGNRLIDAFTSIIGTRTIVMLTDDKNTYARSRFDAAHELGHLVLHGDSEPGTKVVETQAHYFAAAFLFPKTRALEELPRQVDATGWAALAQLKRRWGISMSALLYRAKTLNILSPDSHQRAMKYMSMKGWRSVEPGDREMGSPESPLLLDRALSRIDVEFHISREELVKQASLPLEDTLELVNASVDRRPLVEL